MQVREHAEATPDKPAGLDDRREGTRRLTVADLHTASNRLANVLVERGVGLGAKGAWCGQNSVDVATLVSAAQRLGVTAVPVNYRFTDNEAAYVINHSDAAVVYVDAEQAPMLRTRISGGGRRGGEPAQPLGR